MHRVPGTCLYKESSPSFFQHPLVLKWRKRKVINIYSFVFCLFGLEVGAGSVAAEAEAEGVPIMSTIAFSSSSKVEPSVSAKLLFLRFYLAKKIKEISMDQRCLEGFFLLALRLRSVYSRT